MSSTRSFLCAPAPFAPSSSWTAVRTLRIFADEEEPKRPFIFEEEKLLGLLRLRWFGGEGADSRIDSGRAVVAAAELRNSTSSAQKSPLALASADLAEVSVGKS